MEDVQAKLKDLELARDAQADKGMEVSTVFE
jgi:hypothetical protein